MGAYIQQAKDKIKTISSTVTEKENFSVNFGLVAFRDHPPQDATYSTKVWPLTSSIDEMYASLCTLSAAGGGDAPEAVTCALSEASKMAFRPGSVRVVVIISDAPPHGLDENLDGFPDGCPCGIDPLEVARDMVDKGIVIYSVGVEPALGTFKNARAFYRALSDITHGRFLGLGNAHLLSDVIVGGLMEEMSLSSIEALVLEESRSQLKNSQNKMTIGEVSTRVHEQLIASGLSTWKLEVSHQLNPGELPDAEVISKCKNLTEALKNLKESQIIPTIVKPLDMSSFKPAYYDKQNVIYNKTPVSVAQVEKVLKKSGGISLHDGASGGMLLHDDSITASLSQSRI